MYKNKVPLLEFLKNIFLVNDYTAVSLLIRVNNVVLITLLNYILPRDAHSFK